MYIITTFLYPSFCVRTGEGLYEIENKTKKRKNRDHPDYSIVEFG